MEFVKGVPKTGAVGQKTQMKRNFSTVLVPTSSKHRMVMIIHIPEENFSRDATILGMETMNMVSTVTMYGPEK